MFRQYVPHVSAICATCFGNVLHVSAMCYMFRQYVLHVSAICVTCFGNMRYMFRQCVTCIGPVDHPQAFKYIHLKQKIECIYINIYLFFVSL
jgi:hypothetical protein